MKFDFANRPWSHFTTAHRKCTLALIPLLFTMQLCRAITCLKCVYTDAQPTDNIGCLDPNSGNGTTGTCDGSSCYTAVNLPSPSNTAIIIERGCISDNETEADARTDCEPLRSSKYALKHNIEFNCSCSDGDNCNIHHVPFERRKCYTCTYIDNEDPNATIAKDEPCLRKSIGSEYCPDNLRRGASLCVKVSGIKVGDGYIRVVQRECQAVKNSLGCHNVPEFLATSSKNPAIPLRDAFACYCAADDCNGTPDWQPQTRKKNKGGVSAATPSDMGAFIIQFFIAFYF